MVQGKSVLDAYKAASSEVNRVLSSRGMEARSCGTKELGLGPEIDKKSGFWASKDITNKPPRWILHADISGPRPIVRFASKSDGQVFPAAATPGYVNIANENVAAAFFRILVGIGIIGHDEFLFPEQWEWVVFFVFSQPLSLGNSGELLSDVNTKTMTIAYKGRALPERTAIPYAKIGIVKTLADTKNFVVPGKTITYSSITEAVSAFLSSEQSKCEVYDIASPTEVVRLGQDVEKELSKIEVATVGAPRVDVAKAAHLFGISDDVYSAINASLKMGKRHFILHGPPGTGKTTLAEHIARELSGGTDENSFIDLTASSSWSSQDLIGGYQPLGPGKLGFVPGVLLRDFDKPFVIDELNRCPIDKVIGPLFNVLSGQVSNLPFRQNIENPKSGFYRILPKPKKNPDETEFCPGPNWALICTLNPIDKSQLGQLSYALSRRFTWIRIGVPANLDLFVQEMLRSLGIISGTIDLSKPNPVAAMWKSVNKVREIGGAPIIDFIKLTKQMNDAVNFLAEINTQAGVPEQFILALGMCVSPLLDGISKSEIEGIKQDISAAWKLSNDQADLVSEHFKDLAS